MPKNTKKKNKKQIVKSNNYFKDENRIERADFRVQTLVTATANSTTPFIQEVKLTIANCGARIIAIGDVFSYWRISRLHVYSNMSVTSSPAASTFVPNDICGEQAIAFTAASFDNFTIPTTFAQLNDFPVFTYGNSLRQLSIKLGPKDLYGSTPVKWFNTATQGSSQFQSPGTLEYVVANTVAVTNFQMSGVFTMEGTVEFKQPIDPNLIPLDKVRSRISREIADLKRRECLEFSTDDNKSDHNLDNFLEQKELK